MPNAKKRVARLSAELSGPCKREEAVLDHSRRCDTFVWDFSTDGGAVGDLTFGRTLPANAMVVSLLTEELTAVTGATDITIKAGSTALSGSIDFTADAGIQSRALAGSAAGIKLSATSEYTLTVATNAATAGKVRFYVEYLLPNE